MSRRFVIPSVIVFVLATGFILVLSPHSMRRVQAVFLGLISPLLKSGSGVEKTYRGYREGLKNVEQLEEDNKRLLVANKEMSATNQILRGLDAENNRLRKALEYRERAAFKLTPARIIARDSSTWYSKIVIDRGTADGLKEDGDQAVLTEEGLVGKTTVVADHSAAVVLISDEACRVAATVEGTREQGIVKGERASTGTTPSIGLNFLSKQANLKTGANIYSSGVGGVFPSGVLIGQVKEFKMRELDGHASIVPAVDLSTLEDVFVVVGDNK
jgi:rod shape-determining protein MreC